MHVIFDNPKPLNLEELAQVNKVSFWVLEPWCQENHEKSLNLQLISKYMAAIADSVQAARCGYEEQSLQHSEDMINRDTPSKEEHDNFARIMLKYAGEAPQRPYESLEKFRNVCDELSKSKDAQKDDDDQKLKANLDRLENDNIPAFENLTKCVADYIDWWSCIVLGANAGKLDVEQLNTKYWNKRSNTAIGKRGNLKESFVRYVVGIGKVQDDHRHLFSKITGTKASTSKSEVEVLKYQNPVEPIKQTRRLRKRGLLRQNDHPQLPSNATDENTPASEITESSNQTHMWSWIVRSWSVFLLFMKRRVTVNQKLRPSKKSQHATSNKAEDLDDSSSLSTAYFSAVSQPEDLDDSSSLTSTYFNASSNPSQAEVLLMDDSSMMTITYCIASPNPSEAEDLDNLSMTTTTYFNPSSNPSQAKDQDDSSSLSTAYYSAMSKAEDLRDSLTLTIPSPTSSKASEDTSSVATPYSNASSSATTEYGFYWKRRALSSSVSLSQSGYWPSDFSASST